MREIPSIYALFHHGLNEGGFLLLGSAETMESSAGLFTMLDGGAHIICRPAAGDAGAAGAGAVHDARRNVPQRHPPRFKPKHGQVVAALYSGALAQAGPPSALVDGSQNFLDLSPAAGRFLLHSAGPPSNLIPAVIRPELRLDRKLVLMEVQSTLESVGVERLEQRIDFLRLLQALEDCCRIGPDAGRNG